MNCVLCDRALESSAHLFLFCEVSIKVWTEVLRWLGFSYQTPPDLFCHWQWWNAAARGKKVRKGYRIVWHAAIWSILKARNDAIFENYASGIEEVVENIKVLSWRWMLTRLTVPACLFYEWCWNPKECLLR